MRDVIYTVGHSTHPLDQFIGLLVQHRITALCDVRSVPYSRVNPQFNREAIKLALRNKGIKYVFMGKELGARSEDEACYENGRVRYDRIAGTHAFQHGLERVRRGILTYRLALMCAEKEPLECHRAILVARHLVAAGLDIQHIHADGKLESHSEAMNRLIRILNLRENQMFVSREELLADAYRRQESRIAYEAGNSLGARAAAQA